MISLLGISGSLRRESFNTALLHAAREMIPDNVSLSIKTPDGIPLYNGDEEAAYGVPESVVDLQKAIMESDAVLIATPEYNNSIPGVLKNAIDWTSRPSINYNNVFSGKPVAVIGASPGVFGTVLAQNAWLPVLKMLRAKPWFGGRLVVPRAGKVFDKDGVIIDTFIKDALKKFMDDFIADIELKDL